MTDKEKQRVFNWPILTPQEIICCIFRLEPVKLQSRPNSKAVKKASLKISHPILFLLVEHELCLKQAPKYKNSIIISAAE